MRPSERQTLLHRLIPFVFVVLWSTGFIFSKIAVVDAEPFSFLVLRFGIVAALLLAASALLVPTWPSRRDALHAATAGALIHGVYLGPVFWAIDRGMAAGISALIVSMQPVLTAFLAPLLVGERVGARDWLAVAVGFGGVALVLAPRIAAGADDVTFATVLVSLLGLLGLTFGNLYQKRFVTGLDLRTGGAFQFLGASLLMLVCAVATERFEIRWTPSLLGALVWSVVVMSIGAITLLMIMIRDGAISQVSTYFYLVPPTTALMAWALFGEQLSGLQLFGMALACLAVVIVGGRPRLSSDDGGR